MATTYQEPKWTAHPPVRLSAAMQVPGLRLHGFQTSQNSQTKLKESNEVSVRYF